MDTTKTATHVSLCAGYCGIDLGLKRAIPSLRTIAFSEIEAFACANLVAKMEAGHLDPAPIWTDVKTFPYASFHGKVDILSGGYPCQPFSAAGKRLGADDPRHLWPFISDGVAAMRPEWCFFENVEGHISLGLPNVIEDLAGMGYRTAWGIFSASECGAPHQRKRVFILAHFCGLGVPRSRNGLGEIIFQRQGRENPSPDCQLRNEWMADTNDSGRQQDRMSRQFRSEGAQQPSCHSRTSESGAAKQIWPSYPNEQQFEWEPPRVVADASIIDGQRGSARTGRRSGSEIDVTGGDEEQQREVEPTLGGDVDGRSGRLDYAQLQVSRDNRTDELRLLGNGVVPATAALAFRTLLTQLNHDLR